MPTAFAQALLPQAVKGGGLRPVLKPLVLVLLATSAFYAVLAWFAGPAIRLLLGSGYADSVPVIRVLLVGLVAAAASSSLTSLLQGGNKECDVARRNARNGVIALGLLALGAWRYGAVGAAVGLVLGYVLQCTSLLLALRVGRALSRSS